VSLNGQTLYSVTATAQPIQRQWPHSHFRFLDLFFFLILRPVFVVLRWCRTGNWFPLQLVITNTVSWTDICIAGRCFQLFHNDFEYLNTDINTSIQKVRTSLSTFSQILHNNVMIQHNFIILLMVHRFTLVYVIKDNTNFYSMCFHIILSILNVIKLPFIFSTYNIYSIKIV